MLLNDRPPPEPVLREAGWLAAPAGAALLILLATGLIGPGAAALGVLVVAAGSIGLGFWRGAAQMRLSRWLRAVEAGDSAAPPDIVAPFGGLVRPIVELARTLRRQRAEIAGQLHLVDTLLQALPDPILLVDRERRVLRANDAALRAFGSGLERLALGRAVRDPGVLAAVGAALEAGSGSSVTFHPPGDRARQLSARIEPVMLPDGTAGVLMTFGEQSEQVMIERMRSDFVANASHEIRTPLASVHGLIETLRGPARDDPVARDTFLEIMAQETARMTRLVDDLLTLSRIELAANQPPTEIQTHEALFAFDRRGLTPQTPEIAEALTAARYGAGGWAAGVEQEVLETGCSPVRVLARASCAGEYDLVRLTTSGLWLGARPADGHLCTPDHRPEHTGPQVLRRVTP